MPINDIFHQQLGGVDERPKTPAEKLAAQVSDMGERCEAAIRLLGEICATFLIERNRESITKGEHGTELLKIADGWIKRYNRIVPAECSGISASWCPIHGDCTCKDPDDKNDDDCPLHSESSTHGDGENR